MSRRSLKDKLRNKEYRDRFVSAHIDTGLPFQIRALREQRGMTQEDLAHLMDTSQEGISRIESPGRGLAIKTLVRLASAFDVALVVRFVPFSGLARWVTDLSPGALEVPDFEHDPGFGSQVAGTEDWEHVSLVPTSAGYVPYELATTSPAPRLAITTDFRETAAVIQIQTASSKGAVGGTYGRVQQEKGAA